jgi:DNA-binding GntR family transcriptional regulator
MTRSQFIELRLIRVALEGLAAALAAERRSDADLEEIAGHHRTYEEESARDEPDPAVAIQANRRFHFSVYAAARSPALASMIEGLWLQIGAVMNLGLRATPKRLRTVAAHQHHSRLLEALKQKDSIVAREALVADVMSAGDAILSQGKLLA